MHSTEICACHPCCNCHEVTWTEGMGAATFVPHNSTYPQLPKTVEVSSADTSSSWIERHHTGSAKMVFKNFNHLVNLCTRNYHEATYCVTREIFFFRNVIVLPSSCSAFHLKEKRSWQTGRSCFSKNSASVEDVIHGWESLSPLFYSSTAEHHKTRT